MNRRQNYYWEMTKTYSTIAVLALVCWALLGLAAYAVADTVINIKHHIAGE